MKANQLSEKLIVIGNGPSLRHFDLHSLTGVTTLGMNAAYRHWDRIGWYPDIYCCLDDELISTHWREIKRLVDNRLVKHAFLTGEFARLVPDSIHDERYYFLDSFLEHWYENRGRVLGLKFVGHPVFASTDPSKLTTGSYAVRYGIMSGYQRIALMGIDLKYVQQIPEARSLGGIKLQMVETPKHNPNYFFDDYQRAGDAFQVPDPAAHSGNLHLAAFETLRNDAVKFHRNVEIVNTSLQSALHEAGVFPYQSLDQFLGRALLDAVVVPARAAERDAILNNLWLWDQAAYTPFLHMRDREPPKLVFYFNNETGREVESQIVDAFEHTATLKGCFSGLEFRFLSLHGDDDLYIRDGLQEAGAQGYKAGPNNQFFEIIRTVGKFWKHILYMETDCIPIRPDWLGQLQDLVQHAEPFWVLGSIYRGKGVLERVFRRHINGNAVYAVGDADFQDFVSSVWQPVLQGTAASNPGFAYDMVLETIFDDAQSHQLNDRVWRLMQSILHQCRHTDFIRNFSGPSEDSECSVPELIRSIVIDSPTTHLLHGQVFLAAVRTLRESGSVRLAEPCVSGVQKSPGDFDSVDAATMAAVVGWGPAEAAEAGDFMSRYLARRQDNLRDRLDRGNEIMARYLASRLKYERLVASISNFVDAQLPSAATVIVVSKGDENLLRLGDRRAWHFPRASNGAYAGYYPADDRIAIDHLESLRSMGAEFLLVPSTAFWWLKHYAEFGRYVIANYRVQVVPEQLAVIFDLRNGPSEVNGQPLSDGTHENRTECEPQSGGDLGQMEIQSILTRFEEHAETERTAAK